MTRRFHALAARLDGLAMLALAGFLLWLAAAGNYWMFLNPKFAPLTLGAATVLAILGAFAAIRPVSRPSLGRAACYLCLLAMIVLTQGGVQALSGTIDSDPFSVAPTLPAPEPAGPVPSRLVALGREYIPINTGELYDIAAKGHAEAFDKPYAMRGTVHRDAALDAKGEFVLYRLAVWCCYADGTAVGFRVRLPQGATPPEDKSWVVAYGRLADAPQDERNEYTLPGQAFSSIAQAALFATDHLESAPVPPEQVYMYQWKTSEPYAF
ncbi:hypothetical protein DFW101_3261 [Solidesulfovibrio carbinoliphilus subsp. oakridgensis]|uniref:DUF1980 domain-containing protein n=1 Tax=Solidesulfovibrio carbinoliphilus subsp. oakridgensis TaxID=694327 RepID=G7QAM9_9BACT|nr:hypothetical protein [Solidesulfovibrio carbinoliphilus]EHJ49260.1 hypothetical protein DFW101_3261 [Solidesulfovibrio carbinoliphilus subsp. oakridgensis]